MGIYEEFDSKLVAYPRLIALLMASSAALLAIVYATSVAPRAFVASWIFIAAAEALAAAWILSLILLLVAAASFFLNFHLELV